MPRILFEPGTFPRKLAKFLRSTMPEQPVADAVRPILDAVRERGDAAVAEFTERFDGVRLRARDFRVSEADLAAAPGALSRTEKGAVREAIATVRAFHRHTLPANWVNRNLHGGKVGERFYPLRRVGVYIPGGQVPLLSTAVMTLVPARVARVPSVAVCTPPGASGAVDPKLLGVLAMCGADEVYRIGGAQAIGALAYGTGTVAPVDKVFGPGNAYVMEAKRQVFGTVGVDLLPGPSEVMVVADEGANPAWVAADLLAQAEHGTGKEVVYLGCLSDTFADKVDAAIEEQLPRLPHAGAMGPILAKRFLSVVCGNLTELAAAANEIAPEHLELQVAPAACRQLVRAITTAGAILMGYHTPTVLGDFAAGPSHTLPTGRAARFSSGLQVSDFMRRSSVVEYQPRAVAAALPLVEAFGAAERLEAHARSLRIRVTGEGASDED